MRKQADTKQRYCDMVSFATYIRNKQISRSIWYAAKLQRNHPENTNICAQLKGSAFVQLLLSRMGANVNMATRLRLNDVGVMVRFLAGASNFFLLYRVQIGTEARKTSHSLHTEVSSAGLKPAGECSWQLTRMKLCCLHCPVCLHGAELN
jgi:hypothetical protein